MREDSVMEIENSFRDKIRHGQKPIGTFIVSGSVDMTEAACISGVDYVIIDNEHTPYEAEITAPMIIAAENHEVVPICRVREVSRPAILKLLDVGAKGLIVPCIKSEDQVRKVVEYAKYKPIGDRGYAGTRKDGWGQKYDAPLPELMKALNDCTLIIPQCETVEALDNIENIAGIEGIDGIFVGPYDLSTAMDMPGDFDNPAFLSALERVVKACKSAGIISMIFCADAGRTASYYKMGFDTVAYNTDVAEYISANRRALETIKEKY